MSDTKHRARASDDTLSLRAIWLIGVCCMGLSLVVAAMAALNTALPDIAKSLKADSSQQTWIVDGYTLVLAALLLPAGAIGDRFGRRTILVAGLALFSVASALPVWVSDPSLFIGARALAGGAAALIMPATLSLITSGLPKSKRPLGVSIWAGVAGVGSIAGFFVTGILLRYFSWHSIFITFAVSAVVTTALSLTIPDSRDPNPSRFDILGSVTSAAAISLFVFGLLEAPAQGWTSPITIGAIVGGLALAALFGIIEQRRSFALLDMTLFHNRAFGSGSFAIVLQFMVSFGLFFVVLQRFQLIMGYSPLMAAVALLPMVVTVMVFSLIGNALASKFNYRLVVSIGVIIMGVATIVMAISNSNHYPSIAAQLVAISVGLGLATASATSGILVNTPEDNHGIGSAVNDTARELGAAVGIALAGSLVATGYAERSKEASDLARQQLPPGVGEQVADYTSSSLAGAMAATREIAATSPQLANAITQRAQDAFLIPSQTAFFVLGTIATVGGIVIAFWAPKKMDQGGAHKDTAPEIDVEEKL